jgi:pimeloyl-ACP methyl ester carboxylesterase
MVRKAYVTTAAGQLHFRECGQGQPLVLLQILPFGSVMFEPVMPIWAELGYRAIAFDLMGYGRSDRRTGEWQVADHTATVIEALGQIGVEPTFLLGGHFGALVAADLALRLGPRVSRLVLDGVPAWDAEERNARRGRNIEIPLVDPEGAVFKSLWERTFRILKTADPQARLEAGSESKFIDAYTAFLALAHKPGTTEAFFANPTMETLAGLRQPTLILGSPTDTLAGCHERASRTVPNATSHFFDTVNPLYCLTRPADPAALAEYAGVVHRFLQGAA